MASNGAPTRQPSLAEQLDDPVHHDRACKARQVIDRIGDKWSVSVIHRLGHETVRFTELRRDVPGISQRMLTATLRGLERDGIVSRTVHPVVPPRVDYTLTELGRTLLATICTLMSWAYDHADQIDAARDAYDRRVSAREGAAAPRPGHR